MPDKVAVIARITARSDAVAEVEAALRTLVDAAADEDGTVEHILHREGDTESFWFYELYADQAALDAHAQTQHFKDIVQGEVIPMLLSRERGLYTLEIE